MTREEALVIVERARRGAFDPPATVDEYMASVAARIYNVSGATVDTADPVAFVEAARQFGLCTNGKRE